MILAHLIAEAVALAGGNLCTAGHDWQQQGGRHCHRCGLSQPAYQCDRCGEWDYGDKGGPAWKECEASSRCAYEREEYARILDGDCQ